MTELRTIPLDMIDEPTTAHRVDIDEQALNELADSIAQVGLLSPIVVRPVEGGRYEIVAGHRRYLAHRRLSRPDILCIVRVADTAQAEVERFAENLQRQELSPMEEAVAISRYIETTGMDTKQVARALARTEWWVTHRLALLEMPPELGDMVHTGQLAAAAALALAKVTDDRHRRYLLEYAVRSGASVAVIREWVAQWELQMATAPDGAAPLPEMPADGQPVIVQMPCHICGTPHDHRQLIIARVCRACDGELRQ